MFLLISLVFLQKDEPVTLPFIKADKINSERVMYTKSCLQNVVRTFDERPVYFVQYSEKGEENGLIKVGSVSCCFLNENGWIEGRAELDKPVPKNYVLRAHVRATRAETTIDGRYVVNEVEVVKFYLKRKDKAVNYD